MNKRKTTPAVIINKEKNDFPKEIITNKKSVIKVVNIY